MFLLICGCPRSGTTDVARFFNEHSDVYVGCERYILRYEDPAGIGPQHFSPARFRDLRQGDTFWRALDEMPGWASVGFDRPGVEKLGHTRIFGDKAPYAAFYLERILAPFMPDCRAVVCIRDVLSVGRSWQMRADDRNDPLWARENGFEAALPSWTAAMIVMLKAQANGFPAIDVFVQDLFREDRLELRRTFDALGLDLTGPARAAWNVEIELNRDQARAERAGAKSPTPEERRAVIHSPDVLAAVLQMQASGYRVPLDRLFWSGFEEEFASRVASGLSSR